MYSVYHAAKLVLCCYTGFAPLLQFVKHMLQLCFSFEIITGKGREV